MQELKTKQIEYEIDNFNRSLKYIVEGNIWLKNRLSEILKSKFDRYLLEEVDEFQNRFIKLDEMISLIRNDLFEVKQPAYMDIFENSILKPEIEKKVKKLRNNLNTAEKQFGVLKTDFNIFLSESIL